MNSISRTAKTLDKVFAVLYWLIIAGIVLLLIMAVTLATPLYKGTPLINSEQIYTLTFGSLKLMLAPGVMPQIIKGDVYPFLFAIFLATTVTAVMLLLMMRTVRNILRPFIRQEPFHETIAHGLKRLSTLITVNTALSAFFAVVLDMLFHNTISIAALFLNFDPGPDRFVGAVRTNSTVDVTPLIFAGALYLLSKVFQYGQELQTLSDETL